MHRDMLQPTDLPLSPPPALPSSILHLLIDFDTRSIPLTPSPPEGHHSSMSGSPGRRELRHRDGTRSVPSVNLRSPHFYARCTLAREYGITPNGSTILCP